MTDVQGRAACPDHWAFYVDIRVISTAVLPAQNTTLPGLNTQDCSGVQRRFTELKIIQIKPGRYASAEQLPTETAKQRVELLPQVFRSLYTDDRTPPGSLRLNPWTVLRDLVLDPRTASPPLKGKAAGMYLAVLPSDSSGQGDTLISGRDDQGNVDTLKYGGTILPGLPRLDRQLGRYVAR